MIIKTRVHFELWVFRAMETAMAQKDQHCYFMTMP